MEQSTSDPLHPITNGGCRHEHEGTTINGTSDPVNSHESDSTISTLNGGDTVNRRRGDRCLIRLRSMVVVFEENVSVGGKLCKARLEDDHIEWITGKG